MSRKPRNILVLTYFSYKDGLIQTYTLPYVHQMAECIAPEGKIYLLTLEKPQLRVAPEEVVKIKETLRAKGIYWIDFRYHPWGLKAAISWIGLFARLLLLIVRKRITHLHGWATPGGAAGYILSVLTGRPLIVDSYEPHAEAMVENGSWRQGSLAHRLLFFLEKRQTKRARHLIAANEGMAGYAQSRYGGFTADFHVKPACVDLELFTLARLKDPELMEELGFRDKIVCVYAGKFGGIYLDQEVFDFFKVAQEYWGEKFRALLLTNQSDDELKALCRNSGLDPSFYQTRFVMHRDIPAYLGLGDFGITPVKSVYTKRFCTPIKDGEYWALGLPVVITRDISSDSAIIGREGIGYVLEALTRQEYLRAVREIDRLLTIDNLKQRIRQVAERERNFLISRNIYEGIYS